MINDDAVRRIAQQGVAKLLRKKKARKTYGCKDRMCGADDCPNCRPDTCHQSTIEENQETDDEE